MGQLHHTDCIIEDVCHVHIHNMMPRTCTAMYNKMLGVSIEEDLDDKYPQI